jgi:4-amino-4-deoxy-L-arabinose transferase-like glycosyltransferase
MRLSYKLLLIAVVAFVIFLLSKGPSPHQNHYVYLADSFLHGRLDLASDSFSKLNEIVFYNNHYYIVYPPLPAVLMMPFVAVFGTAFDQSLMSIILACVSVATIWLMLKKMGVKENKALWLTALFGFGTCFWFTAAYGSSWYIAQVGAVLFLTLAIVFVLYKKSPFLIGFLLGLAFLCRLPVILSFPFFLLFFYQQNRTWKPRIKDAIYFAAGLAILVGVYELWNFGRWGVFSDLGYGILTVNDPYFAQGLFNISYIPRHLTAIFLQGPNFISTFPYVVPNSIGLGLFFTTPALIYIFKGPWNSLSKKAALAVVCILPILILHGTVGFSQFGYRFSLDFTPFLILLVSKGMRNNLGWLEKGLIILSVLVNLWGVLTIIKFGLVPI